MTDDVKTPHTVDEFKALLDGALAAAEEGRAALSAMASGGRTAEEVARTYDGIGRALGEVHGLSGLYASVHPDAAMREAAEEATQRISAFTTSLGLDQDAYAAFEAIELPEGADPDLVRYVEHTLRDFRRSGVDRDEAARGKIRALQEKLVEVGQQFDRNIVAGGRELRLEGGHADLAGLPADFLDAHPEAEDGSVTLTTDPTDFLPVLLYAERDDVREGLFLKFNQRAYPENKEVLDELLALRHELAGELGYPHYAAWVCEDKMIRTAEAAHDFVDRISGLGRPVGTREFAELEEELRRFDPAAGRIKPWQTRFLIERVKQRKFAFDSQSVRPYFAYDRVEAGVLAVIEQLFGVEVRRNREEPVWHPSVKCFDVNEGGRTVARFYLDMFPREGKFKHAAMFDINGGVPGESLPQAALVCNFPEPSESDPALLLHDQVTTVFHEFGHLLHHLFAVQPWYGFSGIRCEWDFVEVPSQLFEEWAWSVDVLQRFALHHETEEPIPAELVERLRAAEEYGKGIGVMGQMMYAKFALCLFDSDPAGLDPGELFGELQREMTFFEKVEGTAMECSFGHLHGYSASYYTYMWSLVIAKDFFGAFGGAGLMDAALAARYRQAVLAPGGARDAAEMAREFLGREVSFDAWQAWLQEA